MTEFKIGDRFSSYREVQEKIDDFANKTFATFWKREARTIEASKKYVSRKIKEDLVYYQLMYSCIHGGQRFRKKGNNIRQTSTFKENCNVHVRFKASLDGQSLEVTSVEFNHNHDTSKILHAHVPKQRKPDPVVTKNIKDYMDMRANKKIVQSKIKTETGKLLTLKDLSNIAASGAASAKENLESCIQLLQEKYNADVSVSVDNDSCFRGLYIQTAGMKRVMETFPEFLAIDATYKLLKIGTPLFLIIAEDGNCQSEIVAVCILVSEEKENLTWFLETFQNKNPNWVKTACIMTDKDLSERTVIRQLFPEVNLIICVFHTMKIFYREISMEKLNITKQERNLSLEIIQKIIHSKSDEEYEEHRQLLKNTTPPAVYQYFLNNWHTCKDEWYLGENYFRNSFLNKTNNRLESINQKLKSVIKKDSGLENFILGLFTIIGAMENERDHKAIYGILKKPVNMFTKGSDEEKYFDLLTREASKYILGALGRSKTQTFAVEEISRNLYLINRKYNTTIKTCNCTFYISMLMPCKHIFFLRKRLNEPLFETTLVNIRWTSKYYNKNQRCFYKTIDKPETFHTHNDNVEATSLVSVIPKTLKTHQQRRKNALFVSTDLAELAAQYTGNLFAQRMKLLTDLKSYWSQGISVGLVPLESDSELKEYTITKETDAENYAGETSSSRHSVQYDNNVELELLQSDHPIEVDSNNASETVTPSNSLNKMIIVEPSKTDNVEEVQCDDRNYYFEMVNNIQPESDIVLEDKNGYDPSNNASQSVTSTHTSKKVKILQMSDSSKIKQVPPISEVRMPVNIKKRGRPKGRDLTVIGLPKKRKMCLPQAFIHLPDDKKKVKILRWLEYDDLAIIEVHNGILLNKFPLAHKEVPDSLIDENVDLRIVRDFFTTETFLQIVEAVNLKKTLNTWSCQICSSGIEKYEQAICCDGCLMWFHFHCAPKSKNTMKTTMYFCKTCYNFQ